jgi:hypothetical protein
MQLYSKLSALGAVLVLSTAFASANTITIASQAGSTVGVDTIYTGYTATIATPGSSYSGNIGTSFALSGVTPTWASALDGSTWVGVAPTAGPSGTVDPARGIYTFTLDLGSNLEGYSGSIEVLADDTSDVWLNGVPLIAEGGGNDVHCDSTGITCLTHATTVNLSGLLSTDNVLTFNVIQAGTEAAGSDPSGLDFAGSISNGVGTAATPEPSTLLLLGTGLLGSAGALFRKMRA